MRLVLMAFMFILAIICSIIYSNIDNIVDYDISIVGGWNQNYEVKRIHNRNRFKDLNPIRSHIGNLYYQDNEGNEFEDNWVLIGNRFWKSHDVENVEYDAELGKLISVYSYRINDKNDPYYGEAASFWIYDISTLLEEYKMSREIFYQFMHDNYANDSTTLWESTDEFKPLLALCTKPRVFYSLSQANSSPVYKESFLIFANDRIYEFNFSNDKYDTKGEDGFGLFHRRCKSVVDDTDFSSYNIWERDYNNYMELSEKQESEREFWSVVLLIVCITCCFSVFYLSVSIKKLGKENRQAKYWAFYIILCFLVGFIVIIVCPKNDTINWLFDWFLTTVICSIMYPYLAQKSNESYNIHFLLPDIVQKWLKIQSEFKKRLILLFIVYPIILFLPIPFIKYFALVLYILPVILLLISIRCIIWIISWLNAGRKVDSNTSPHLKANKNEIARIYCRHCGKLIDADSDYCRYCGKKL